MSLGADDVRTIARLARLAVPAAAQEGLARELSAILDLAQRLDSAVTQPGAQTAAVPAVLRPDVVSETDGRETLLALAPAAQDGVYRVPRVIE